MKGTDVEGGDRTSAPTFSSTSFLSGASCSSLSLSPAIRARRLPSQVKDRPQHLLWREANSEIALGAFREGGSWSVCRGNYANDADAVISRDHSGAAAPALFL